MLFRSCRAASSRSAGPVNKKKLKVVPSSQGHHACLSWSLCVYSLGQMGGEIEDSKVVPTFKSIFSQF